MMSQKDLCKTISENQCNSWQGSWPLISRINTNLFIEFIIEIFFIDESKRFV